MDFELPPELKKMQQETRQFVDREIRPLVSDIEKRKKYPIEIVRKMAGQGIYRLLVPKEYGGMYETVRSLPICVVREELGRGHNFAGASIATQGLGSYPLVLAGSPEIRKRFLPKVASGEVVPAFALTEPEAGSDAGSLRTTALKEGDSYRINGTKCFISNAGIAQYIVLLAKTDPTLGTKGISAILVETGTPGYEISRQMEILAIDVVNELKFKDCLVPRKNLLGEEGKGFAVAMQTLDLLRCSVGAHAVGIAQEAFDLALAYAKKRVQFGKPIAQQQAIQLKLANMIVEINCARLLVYQAALAKDTGQPEVTFKSSMAKYYSTEMAQRVVDQAVQIHGGNGVLMDDFPLERLYREVRAPRIYEGTSEIQQFIIANHFVREKKK
ncbi:MAG: acyl-CoA dehydrogenase family protein [Thermodesulfobacteriota bacterium]|jgi:alkylation response protein AidB-like acyl-CoA dehydrogenase